MIVIPIDMWPHGYSTKKYPLGEIRIINDRTGTSSRGNYIVQVYGKSKNRPARTGTIKNWPRISRPVHELVLAALLAVGYRTRKADESSTPEQTPCDEELPLLPHGNQET